MHIALVIPTLKGGGAERVVLNLAQGFIDRGHHVDIVLRRPVLHYSEDVPADARLFFVDKLRGRFPKKDTSSMGARLRQLPRAYGRANWLDVGRAFEWNLLRCRPDLRLLNFTRAIASYIARERPECVLPSLPLAKIATLMAGRFLKIHPPIIPIIHSNYEHRRPRDRCRLRYMADQAAHFVGVSQGVCDAVSRLVGVSSKDVTAINNPVVTEALVGGVAMSPSHPWLQDDGVPTVLAAGRLQRVKDYPTLIKAFARLAARRPCRLIILGEGKQRKKLQALVRRLGLDDRVSLPGWVDDPFVYMANASLFVVSSIYEGLSMVLVEALACGCPSVSTNCPFGPAEILLDGKLGPLVAVGDEAGLAMAMERVLEKPPDKGVLRRRAEDFSVNTAVTAYERLIQAVASGSVNRSTLWDCADAGRAGEGG
ncbi:MAG: glycosyltransferase [Deltaproteobacteria bacterium]|nr:glycosyltransferase [Deltaproteobacteria bacterium]